MPSSKYNILVTGSNGQLGSEIKELSQSYSYNFFFTDRDTLDITNEEAIILQKLKEKLGIKLVNEDAYNYKKFLTSLRPKL